MADSRPAVVEQPTERAEAFLRLADEHLDAAYRLARAILRDADRARRTPHTTRSSRLGASGRRSETRRASSPGSTGSSSTPVATGCDPLVGNRPTSRPRSRSPLATRTDRRMTASCSQTRSRDCRPITAWSSPSATTGTSPWKRLPAAWASLRARSSRASTTPSSASTPRSALPTAREPSDDRRPARTAPAELVPRRDPGRRDGAGCLARAGWQQSRRHLRYRAGLLAIVGSPSSRRRPC